VGGNVPVDSSLFIESIASKYQYLLVLLTVILKNIKFRYFGLLQELLVLGWLG
jgi:hypothetical protein